jgi:hypothetical protein
MISPPPGPNNQHRHDLEITEGDRDLLWRLMRVGGSKAMPGDMQAFLAGIEMALGRYRQSKAEDHRRRSAREDLRDLFMACDDGCMNLTAVATHFNATHDGRPHRVTSKIGDNSDMEGNTNIYIQGLYIFKYVYRSERREPRSSIKKKFIFCNKA